MNRANGVPHGVYGAINTVSGKVAWSIPIPTSAPNSGVAVGGDLVFFADAEGLFYGVNAATGEILWVFDALSVPGGGGGGACSKPFMSTAASSTSSTTLAAIHLFKQTQPIHIHRPVMR